MKKFLALTTAVLLAFGMTGCGKVSKDDEEKKGSVVTTTTSLETTTTTTATTTTTTATTTKPITTTTAPPALVEVDYADAESFEAALNNGENLEGKIVQFVVGKYIPGATLGNTICAGEYLNFISSFDPKVKAGDVITVKVTSMEGYVGVWIINYEMIDNATVKVPETTTEKVTTTVPETTTAATTTTFENPSSVSPFGWQGSGDFVATDLVVENYAIITASHSGESNFIIHANGDNGNRSLLVNTIGNYYGSTLIVGSGTYEIEINADGNWSINAYALSMTDDTSFSGSGDFVTPIFDAENTNWNITNNGESNFVVRQYPAGSERYDLLVNEIGAYSGVVKSKYAHHVFFEINSSGNWSISPA